MNVRRSTPAQDDPTTPPPEPRRPDPVLWAILAVALVLRLGWWFFYVDIIENEGVEYTRLAWNWFHDRGYVSVFGGTHTLFPPLYPLLIGLTAPLAGSGEVAARLVSLVAGLAVVWAVYQLALVMFTRKVALLAAGLAACHPLLVALAVTTYSEALFIAWTALGALAAVRCIQRPTLRTAALTGGLVGVAYLTRPEGIALAAAFGGLALLAGLWRDRRLNAAVLAHPALIVGVAGLVAAPYVAHLTRIGGTFRWEGKSAINNIITNRMDAGLSYREAGRGLGPDGEPLGAFMFPDQEGLLAAEEGGAGGLTRSLMVNPVGRLKRVPHWLIGAKFLGSPLLLVLVFCGLAFAPWWRTRLAEGLALIAVPALSLAALLSLRFTWDRYFYPLLPVSIIWAAAAIERAGWAAARLLESLGASERARQVAGGACVLLLSAGLIRIASSAVPQVDDLVQTRRRGAREAGAWIRQDHAAAAARTGARPRIASLGLALAHYAGGEVIYLPYADEQRALVFLRRASPDYIALRTSEVNAVPYGKAWVESRISGVCAEPVQTLPGDVAAHYRIWRWKCSPELRPR